MTYVYSEEDGRGPSLEERLVYLAEEHPVVIGRVLAEMLSRHPLGDEVLQECGVLESDEWTSRYRMRDKRRRATGEGQPPDD